MADTNKDSVYRGSADRFGFSWAIFHEILPEHREQFIRWTAALPPELWKGARFLDAGCGIGRNSYWATEQGASGGLAIDIDERSLEAARANLASKKGVEVRFQSVYDLAEQNVFDVAFSIGVVHHLADPQAAISRMMRATKPGGYVMIWVYGAENTRWLMRFFDPLRRGLFSRLPLRLVYHLSLYPTLALWLALKLGLSRLEYYRLIRRFNFSQLRVIVFDQMIPRIAHYWSREQVEAMMQAAGLQQIRLVHVNEMSWSAAGKKPTDRPDL